MSNGGQRVEIDVTPAVTALAQLTQSLDKHNEKVKEARTQTQLLARTAKKSHENLREARDELMLATTAVENHKEAVQKANAMYRNQNRVMDTSRTRFMQMNGAIRSTNTAIGALERKTDTYRETIRKLNTMGQAESLVRERNKNSLIDFGQIIGQVTTKLARKNDNINAQARAHRGDTAALIQNTNALRAYGFSLQNVSRIYIHFLTFGALFKLSREIQDAVRTAKEWEQAMSEIITVSDRATFTTAHWRSELTQLSNAFGMDVLEGAEATYEALSNQVVTAGEASRFMREEVKLSLATVSTLMNSVNATSSAIQAFGFSQSDSSRINAIYFKTVEEGRVRLNEMADSIGRVSVLSNELNVSFVEQQAAIAMLTRKGIEADVAMTLLRNVMLKLAKPTDAMKEIFAEVGVTSGQAMIAAYGLGETLRLLAERASGTGDRAAEMAELFGDIRAITGAAALTQGDLNEEMKKFGTAGVSYVKAVEERFNALDTRANVQLQRFNNLLINSFGQPILKKLVEFTENMGGIETVFLSVYQAGRSLLTMFLSFKAATIAVSLVQTDASQKFLRCASAVRNLSQAMRLASFAMNTMKIAMSTLATVGIVLAIEAIQQLIFYQSNLGLSAEMTTSQVMNAYDKMAMHTSTRLQATIDDATTAYELQLRLLMQGWRQYNVDLLQTVNATTKGAEDRFKALGDAIKASLEEPLDGMKDKLKDALSETERVLREMETRSAALESFKREDALGRSVADVDGAKDANGLPLNEEQKYLQLMEIRKKLEEELQSAVRGGNLALFDELRGRADALDKELESRLLEYKKKSEEVIKTSTSRREWQGDPLRRDQFGRMKPRIVTVTETTEQVANAQGIVFAQQQLLELEKQRRAQVDARIAAEEGLIKKQQENAAREQAKLKAQEAALAVFQKTLAAMDSFKAGEGTAADFAKLIKDAEAQSTAAGLDPMKRLELLRQAKAQEIELNRMALQKMIEEETRIKSEALDKMNEEITSSLEAQQKAKTESIQQEQEAMRQLLEDAQNVYNVTQAMDTWFQSPVVSGTAGANQEQTDLLAERVKTLNDVARRLKEETLNVQNAPEEKRARALMVYNRYLKEYQTALGEVLRMQNAYVTGMGTVPLGQYKLGDEKNLAEALRSTFELIEKLDEARESSKKAVQNEALLNEQLLTLKQTLGTLPKAYEEDAAAANANIEAKIARNAVYIQQLERTLQLLQAQRQAAEAAMAAAAAGGGGGPARAFGGQVGPQHFAMGGSPRGTDMMPAMISPREMVMTEAATAAYSPLFNMLNRERPSVTNSTSQTFGDINISLPSGSSVTQVRAFAKELTRQSRLGLLGTRGE